MTNSQQLFFTYDHKNLISLLVSDKTSSLSVFLTVQWYIRDLWTLKSAEASEVYEVGPV